MRIDLLDKTLEEMKEFAAAQGERPYRGKQLFKWIYGQEPEGEKPGESHSAVSIDDMSDLSKDFRNRLKEVSRIGTVHIEQVQEDPNDGTRKFLFRLGDEEESPEVCYVEGVLMKYRYGNTLCVSSQAGCRMGCRFCASSLGGFLRDLTAGEMVGQVLAAESHTAERINHIVIMGMGEPFDNYENVGRFLNIMHELEGRNMSWRNMTVSTCGLVPEIDAFAKDFPQVNLAISLHRTTDSKRDELMPINRKYPLEELMDAARRYTEETHRRITFEYALIAGENDSDQDAKELAGLLKGMLCHVNLIPLNEVDETGLRGSGRKRAEDFAQQLMDSGIPTTLRRRLGGSISGACGQLRLKKDQDPTHNI